ncbi:MAG: general stress protein YciG [Janthinobacterium sp.]|jgi:general stress protein YciG
MATIRIGILHKEISMASKEGAKRTKGNSQTSKSSSMQKGGMETGKRGFAAMDQQLQREIASKGGQAAHQKGTAHEFDSNEARSAGQKGGVSVSRDREHMAEIGRRGGESRQAASSEMESSSSSALPRARSEKRQAGKQGNKAGNK